MGKIEVTIRALPLILDMLRLFSRMLDDIDDEDKVKEYKRIMIEMIEDSKKYQE